MVEIIEYINIAAVTLYCVSLIILGKYYFYNRQNNENRENRIKKKIGQMIFHKEIGNKIEDLNGRVNEVRLKIQIPSSK